MWSQSTNAGKGGALNRQGVKARKRQRSTLRRMKKKMEMNR